MEITALIVLATLATKIIDVLKYLQARDWNGVFTQVSVWAAGVIVIFMAAQAQAFEGVQVPSIDQALGLLDFWSLVIVGLSITSLLSTVYDFKKAIDNTDSASVPALLPGLNSNQPAPD